MMAIKELHPEHFRGNPSSPASGRVQGEREYCCLLGLFQFCIGVLFGVVKALLITKLFIDGKPFVDNGRAR